MAEPISAIPGTALPNSPGGVQCLPGPKLVQQFPELTEPASANKSKDILGRLRGELERSYDNMRDLIGRNLERSRRQFHQLSEEHPVQLVISVAIAAFLTGAALRIWRSNHD